MSVSISTLGSSMISSAPAAGTTENATDPATMAENLLIHKRNIAGTQ